MPGFKDYIAKDLDVFFNPEEFSESHKINGKDITVVIDNDQLKERTKKEYDSITVGEIQTFVDRQRLWECPVLGGSQSLL
jgi:hypothetical protein